MSDKIVLGSGKLYIQEAVKAQAGGYTIPADNVIEQDTNLIGWIQGGATLEYTPEFYTAKDDLGKVSKKYLTSEEAILKSGVMTWNGNTLAKLTTTAEVTETGSGSTGKRTVKIGGIDNYDGKNYVIRFLHEDIDGDVRITIVGSNESGFEMAFAKDTETVINAEFKAVPNDARGTLIIFEEEDSAIEPQVPTYEMDISSGSPQTKSIAGAASATSDDESVATCSVSSETVTVTPEGSEGDCRITVKNSSDEIIAFIHAYFE